VEPEPLPGASGGGNGWKCLRIGLKAGATIRLSRMSRLGASDTFRDLPRHSQTLDHRMPVKLEVRRRHPSSKPRLPVCPAHPGSPHAGPKAVLSAPVFEPAQGLACLPPALLTDPDELWRCREQVTSVHACVGSGLAGSGSLPCWRRELAVADKCGDLF